MYPSAVVLGSASDTQSSDMGPFPMMTDDSTRLTLNSGNDMSSSSGNGSLLNKTLLGSNDDAKKSKVSKSKKHKSVSLIQLSLVRQFEQFISFETSTTVNGSH